MVNSSTSDAHSCPELQTGEILAIDSVFEEAGLVRNLRAKGAGVTRRARLNRARIERGEAEELFRTAAEPLLAPNGVQWLPVSGWRKFPWLWHGFSTRKGGLSRAFCAEDAQGELNLGFSGDDRETVARNRRLFAEAITGDSATPLVCLRQIHSSLLVVARTEDAGCGDPSPLHPGDRSSSQVCRGDGLMTDEPGLLLGIQTADCIPVLVADRKRRAVAAFHAGWRGTVNRIVEKGIGRMRLEFGSRPEDLIAAIGPGIGPCCYAVGEEVLSSFESQFSYARELFREVYSVDPVRTRYPMLFLTQRAPGHSEIGPSLHLDLVEANRRQLLAAGLKPRSIKIAGGCTSCQPELFFSHRASQGHAGRMMSAIGIRGRTGARAS
jgi:YfiH family protein